MKTVYLFIGIAALLVAAAIFLPSNTLTGHVIKEGSCKEIGCVEMCDVDAENSCTDKDTVCCFTHWDTGVCDYDINCETIREYSLYQTFEQYRSTVEERPAQVYPSLGRFFLPLLVALGIIVYFMHKREEHIIK